LLNEVQDLIARHGPRYRFALTGSSARKLKRGGANLLPARLVNRRFFPLTAAELRADWEIDAVLRFGCLPAVCAEKSGDAARIDLLEAYAENYLAQEIRDEAVVRRLDSFTRRRWRREDGTVVAGLCRERVLRAGFGVYLGRERLREGPVTVLPIRQFLDALGANEVIG
jgi:hypothetical protein